jgi:hypothetical protein
VDRLHRSAIALGGLLLLASFPAAAVGGYDIAHIVKRTCEPSGPLIVTDEWKSHRDRDRLITEPGEVITCPPGGPKNSFQIAAGPEPIGPDTYLCTYVSLLSGDGADTCVTTDSDNGEDSFVDPLMAVRTDRSGTVALVGIVGDDVTSVSTAPPAAPAPDGTFVPIDAKRAAGLGATHAFSYFSLDIESAAFCADEPPRLLARNSPGQVVAESLVPMSTGLLDAADQVPYARSLKDLCSSPVPSRSVEVGWMSEIGAVVRSLLSVLI